MAFALCALAVLLDQRCVCGCRCAHPMSPSCLLTDESILICRASSISVHITYLVTLILNFVHVVHCWLLMLQFRLVRMFRVHPCVFFKRQTLNLTASVCQVSERATFWAGVFRGELGFSEARLSLPLKSECGCDCVSHCPFGRRERSISALTASGVCSFLETR